MESIKGQYELTREACSEISRAIMDFCTKIRVERKEALKVCMSAEDCLEYWMNNGLEGNRVTLRVGMKLTTPVVSLEIEGNAAVFFRERIQDADRFMDHIDTDPVARDQFDHKFLHRSTPGF